MAKKQTKDEAPEKELSFHEKMHAELEADRKDGHHYGYASGAEVIKFPEKITTGSIVFDIALEGGFRCGWSRFSGDPQMGKTAQGLCWAAQWQKHFGDDAFIVAFNAEGRVTADLCVRSAVDVSPERFLRLDTNVGDYAVEKMQKWVTHNPSGKRFFFLTDSSDALIRAHDLDKGADKAEKIGGGATLLSYTGKRLSLPISVFGHHLYITSQLRDKMNSTMGGKSESGGNAPKYYSSLSGRMKKYWVKGSEDGNIYDDKKAVIGHKTLVDLYKSPNEAVNEVLLHVQKDRLGGIWKEYELLYILATYSMITTSGSWLSTSPAFTDQLVKDKVSDGPVKAQGELKMVRLLEAEPKLVAYLEEYIRATLINP